MKKNRVLKNKNKIKSREKKEVTESVLVSCST